MNDVERSFGVEDVQEGPPDWPTLLRRGLRRRCPRCGGGGLFQDRFRIKERCPTCGLRVAREPGYRLGAWFINFLIMMLVHWIAVMIWILWRSSQQSSPLIWPLLVGAATAVVVPIVTYPWSLTLWSAIDLGMTPLELQEIVDAADALDETTEDGGREPGGAGDIAGGGGGEGPDRPPAP